MDLCVFLANLINRAGPRTANATQRKPVLENKQANKNKKLKVLIYHLFCMCVCVPPCLGTCMEVRGQLVGVSYLLPLLGLSSKSLTDPGLLSLCLLLLGGGIMSTDCHPSL